MKYPREKFIVKDILESEVYARKSSYWCEAKGKRWVHAADVFMFGEYITSKDPVQAPIQTY